MPSLKHTHTYTRYKKHYYKCNDPQCTHFADRSLILGKMNKCPFCGKEWVLTKEDLRRATPRCIECSDTKQAKVFDKAKAAASLIFKLPEEVGPPTETPFKSGQSNSSTESHHTTTGDILRDTILDVEKFL